MADKMNRAPGPADAGEELDRFEVWVTGHNREILWGSGILVLVIVAIAIAVQYHSGEARRSRDAFSNTETVEQIETVLKEHDSGAAASEARIRLSRLLAAKMKYADAARTLDKVAADTDTMAFIRARAAIDAAYMTELDSNLKDAAARFRKAADDMTFPEDIRIEAAYSAGRIYAAEKNYSEARAMLGRANIRNANNQGGMALWADLAARELDRLPAASPAGK